VVLGNATITGGTIAVSGNVTATIFNQSGGTLSGTGTLTISGLLFDSLAFKNAICLGPVLDADGQEMSTSRGNVVNPWEALNAHGADAFRWYLYTAAPPGQERRFKPEMVGEVVRNFVLMLWNTYSFFTTYARLDEWKPDPSIKPEYSALDKWLLSAMHTLIRDVTQAMENYDVNGCSRPVERSTT
jgi:isoleucyl-tRNA synthetase